MIEYVYAYIASPEKKHKRKTDLKFILCCVRSFIRYRKTRFPRKRINAQRLFCVITNLLIQNGGNNKRIDVIQPAVGLINLRIKNVVHIKRL